MYLPQTLGRVMFLQALAAAGVAAGVLLALVWLLQSLRFLDFLINKGLGVGVFLHLTGLLIPQLLTIILPIAVLAGALAAARRWQDDHETTAALAAGIAPWRLKLPLLLLALTFSGVLYALMLVVLPASTTAFKNLQLELRNQQGQLFLEEGTFNPLGADLMVYVKERRGTQGFTQLLVHDSRRPDAPVTWYARYGELRRAASGVPQLVLQQGMRQSVEQAARQGEKSTVTLLEFASYNLDLNLQLGESVMSERKPEVEEGSIAARLAEARDPATSPKQANKLRAEVAKRLTWPLLPWPLVMLAAAALLHPPRRHGGVWRGVVPAALLGLLTIGAQFGLLAQAQGGASWALGSMALWPLLASAAALVWYRTRARGD